MNMPLGAAMRQCCAGHVAKAIAAALALLPLRVSWIDNRAEEFPV